MRERIPYHKWRNLGGMTETDAENYVRGFRHAAQRFGISKQVRTVVDIGTGTRALVRALRRAGYAAFGFDLRELFTVDEHGGGEKPFFVADAGSIPLRDGSVDLVCDNLALSDIAGLQNNLENIERACSEIERILSDQGLLLTRYNRGFTKQVETYELITDCGGALWFYQKRKEELSEEERDAEAMKTMFRFMQGGKKEVRV